MRWRILLARLFLCASLIFCSAAIAKKKPPTQPVNINTANSEQLQQVPGIGPATAQKILQMRKSYGPFKSVDDLLAIRGLGQKRLDKMRKYLTVGKATQPKAAPPSENPATAPQKPPDNSQKNRKADSSRRNRAMRAEVLAALGMTSYW